MTATSAAPAPQPTTPPKKPGVYICRGCGIGEAVKVEALEKVAKSELKIAHCVTHAAFCSEDGVATIRKDVEAGTIDGVVIAACSHRVMADKFQFGSAPVVRANLREQVAWSQPAGAEDTAMLAADQIRMSVAQVKRTLPLAPSVVQDYARAVLVVGGGVTGLTAAREASKAGYPVLLVEKSDRLGGWANHWSARMPHRPPYREVQPSDIGRLVAAVIADKQITVRTNTLVAKTAGQPGSFTVTLKTAGAETIEKVGGIVVATGFRPYDATKLGHLGYGASPDVVTGVELEGLLGNGHLKRKSNGAPVRAIAFLQCAGSRDPNHLPYCSSVCCGVSIKQALQVVKADRDPLAPSVAHTATGVSAYIIYDELRTPGTAEEFYREAQRAGVIFMKGKVSKVDGGAMTVTYKDELLGLDVPLQGLDMIVLATGMVPNATDPDQPGIEAEKSAAQLKSDIDPLSPIKVAGYAGGKSGPTPPSMPHLEKLMPVGGPILNLQYRQGPHIPILADGFSDSHYICFPYETRRSGIYTAGPVRRPMDMAESAEDATGAVLKAIQSIEGSRLGASLHPRVGDLSFPKVGMTKCTKCRRCTVECPFGAIDEDEKGAPIINQARCRRCGTCMGACPVQTITFDNYNPQMVNAMIEANEIPDEDAGKPRILVLACENDAYPALDMAGINRSQWSPYVRTIPVRCLGSVTMQWISTALQKGYDGMMLMGCKSGDDYQCHFIKGSHIAKERMARVGETLKSLALEKERVVMEEVAIADSHRVPDVLNRFAELIGRLPANPMKGF